MAKVIAKVMRAGLFGANGEIPVGSEFPVDEDSIPASWKSRITTRKASKDDADLVVNPQSSTSAEQAKAAAEAKAAADKKAADEKAAAGKKDDDKKAADKQTLPGQK